MKRKEFTTEKIKPAPVNWRDAEFVDLKGLYERFGIRRSLAYKLLTKGAIKGVSLRLRGSTRGKRLFDVASVRAFVKGKGKDRRQ